MALRLVASRAVTGSSRHSLVAVSFAPGKLRFSYTLVVLMMVRRTAQSKNMLCFCLVLTIGNAFFAFSRLFSTLSKDDKVAAPPMVYISGEEMTHYACTLIVDQWIKPYFDISAWETYDLSCKSRDQTNDQVLKDAVEAGKRIGAIFKEPTITPSATQVCRVPTHSCVHSSIRQLTVLFFLCIIRSRRLG